MAGARSSCRAAWQLGYLPPRRPLALRPRLASGLPVHPRLQVGKDPDASRSAAATLSIVSRGNLAHVPEPGNRVEEKRPQVARPLTRPQTTTSQRLICWGLAAARRSELPAESDRCGSRAGVGAKQRLVPLGTSFGDAIVAGGDALVAGACRRRRSQRAGPRRRAGPSAERPRRGDPRSRSAR